MSDVLEKSAGVDVTERENKEEAPGLGLAEKIIALSARIHVVLERYTPAAPKRKGRPPKTATRTVGDFTTEDARLLSAEEERDLVVQFHALHQQYLQEMERHPEGSAKSRSLWEQEAPLRTRFTNANIRLISHIANRFVAYLDRRDLITAGVCGLLKALERFEPSFNTRFATYATWYIRQAMQEAVSKESTNFASNISPHHLQEMGHIKYFVEDFFAKEGREPNTEEMSKGTQMSPEHLRQIQGLFHKVSLGTPLDDSGDDFSQTLADNGRMYGGSHDEDPFSSSTLEEVLRDDRIHVLRQKMEELLGPREREVLALRFGLDGESFSLLKIGFKLGICKERVRQIETRALKKLQNALEQQHESFLD